VAQVVEAKGTDHRFHPELPPVDGAPLLFLVGRALDVAAALPPAHVPVAFDDPGSPERAPERVLEVHVPPHHRAVRLREHELGRRGVDGDPQERHELGGDRDAVLVPALARVALVRTRDVQDLRSRWTSDFRSARSSPLRRPV
jgi:hypothetical protein